MKRVVLDTNVLVSALLCLNGHVAWVLRLALSSALEMGVSAGILKEYREVLQRPKFNISRSKLADLFSQIEARAMFVDPAHRLRISPDEAEFLITGNKRHFPKVWKRTRIVNAREFLEWVVPL